MSHAPSKYLTIRLTGCLGSGQFGTVSQGVWNSSTGPVDVAVKTLNDDTSEEEKVKFLQEAAIMGQFLHPNVVKLHGVVTLGDPVSHCIMSHSICRLNLHRQ